MSFGKQSLLATDSAKIDLRHSELIKNAKLFDNHSLIDATSMVYDRDMPEYQSLRGAMVSLVPLARSFDGTSLTIVSAELYLTP